MTFEVRVLDTNGPVTEGEVIEVKADVENTGDNTDTQDIEMRTDDGTGGTLRDLQQISLEPEEITEMRLTWATEDGDAGTYEAVVASEDDQDSTGITVEEDDGETEIPLDVTIDGTNAPITEGEPLCLDLTVENAGEQAGVGTVAVGVGKLADGLKKKRLALGQEGQSAIAHPDMDLEPSEYREGNDAEYEKKVWADTGTDRDEVTVPVSKPPHFATTIEGTNAPVDEGERLGVTATVENNGGERGNATVALAAKHYNDSISNVGALAAKSYNDSISNAGIVDDTGLSLDPGENEQVTLEWNTQPGDDGEHVVSVAPGYYYYRRRQSGLAETNDGDGSGNGVREVNGCLPGDPVDDALVAIDRHGPVKTGLFEVQIDDVEIPGWQSVSLPGRSVEQGSYREGNDPEYEKKTWGQPTFDDLEMERGVKPGETELRDWFEDVRAGKADEGRKEIAVKLLDEEGEVQIQWEFTDAWIKNYDPPELDASADGEMATESITVAYDRMKREEV
ncbi:MAG: phage tail protein [Halovenus sp.]